MRVRAGHDLHLGRQSMSLGLSAAAPQPHAALRRHRLQRELVAARECQQHAVPAETSQRRSGAWRMVRGVGALLRPRLLLEAHRIL